MQVFQKIGTRVQAAKTAINGAGETYHCNAAVADHGLAQVVAQRATNLAHEHPSLSQADAMMLAAREVGLVQSFATGSKPFHEVRMQLDARVRKQSATSPQTTSQLSIV